jgi:hypothetical protein
MGDGMPYHLEKGPVQRILEEYFNAADRARIKTSIGKLDNGGLHDLAWLNQPLFEQLTRDQLCTLKKGPPWSRDGFIKHLAKHWIGASQDAQRNWQAPPASQTGPPKTTGYWHAYQGDVGEIMRKGFQWALKLALNLPIQPDGKPVKEPTTPPLDIEILWKCSNPWFEMWVLRRPVEGGDPNAAVVTVLMATPSHKGATVARSPIATEPKVRRDDASHPVPSTEPDYEELGKTAPRVKPSEARKHAMWVVTHADHELVNPDGSVINPSTSADMGQVEIPLGAVYRGKGDVVIVSPSQPAGGVTCDGKVA